jgi:hypothetical protein
MPSDNLNPYRKYEDQIDHLTEQVKLLEEKNKKLIESLEFTIQSAQRLYLSDSQEGMCPTFYHTLTYEGDLKLKNKTLEISNFLAESILEVSKSDTKEDE